VSVLGDRLTRYAASPDDSLILGDEAIADAAAELTAATGLIADGNVLASVAHLHCLRFLARPQDLTELQIATMCYAPLLTRRPELVPPVAARILRPLRRRRLLPDRNPAKAAIRRALTARHPTTSAWASLLWELSQVLRAWSGEAGQTALLGEAVAVARHAIGAAGAEDPRWLSNLGAMLEDRYLQAREPPLLEEAVEVTRRAAGLAGDPQRGGVLACLGRVLFLSYNQTGQDGDLMAALEASRQAVAHTPPHSPSYPTRLCALGICLLCCHDQTGQAVHLREAIGELRRALAADPDGQVRQLHVLPALGAALQGLYEADGDLGALASAYEAHRAAIEGFPDDHPHFARQAANLAGVLLLRHGQEADTALLDEAISWLGAAAKGSPHAGRSAQVEASLSNQLSVALSARYAHSRNVADLDEAIAQGRLAAGLAVTPPGSRAARTTLAMALFRRYLRSHEEGRFGLGRDSFLREALSEFRRAAAAAPADDPGTATTLMSFGIALRHASQADGKPKLATEAYQIFRRAAGIRAAPPRIRAEAALAAGRVAGEREAWPDASRSLADAVALLERSIPRGLARSDQEHGLTRLRDLPSDAAACAMATGGAELAATLFEQSRGVLLAQAMDVPASDLGRLHDQQPRLWKRFTELRQLIDDPADRSLRPGLAVPGDDASSPVMGTAEGRWHLMTAWEELVAEIRGHAEFRGFLLPPQAADLVAAARPGPVVLVYASDYGSGALLLGPGGVTPVSLPDLSPHAARVMTAELLTLTGPGFGDIAGQNRELTCLLGWLWDAAAGPVMEALGITGALGPGATAPRIWWCPAGLLSYLPLHAAGHHATRHDAVPQTVMDRAISSYTPSVRVLTHARREAATACQTGQVPAALVVAPGEAGQPLPAAGTEAVMVASLLAARTLTREEATRKAVLAALAGCHQAHFACHAVSDLSDPSASHLRLRDHQAQPLTVADLAALRLAHAELAYLSACTTFRGGAELADEAIHLGSAFQLAGFRQVIATLWPVPDWPAKRIAAGVYAGLTGAESMPAALALHRAVARQRDRLPHAPAAWAAYIHSGR
jgi:CHAT domain-containing protein